MTNSSYLADKIRSLRRQKKLSQEELAENSCLSVGAITRIETNVRTPKIETLVKIARALGVTTDELLQSHQEPAKSRHTHDKALDNKTILLTALGASSDFLLKFLDLSEHRREAILAIVFDDASYVSDLDTAQEFERLLKVL